MNNTKTEQTTIWTSEFGSDYTERNRFHNNASEFNKVYLDRYGITRDDICIDWLADLPRNSKILEVGTNLGHQLQSLERVGFSNLYGVEVQSNVVQEVRKTKPQFEVLLSTAQDLPFKDNFFDLVFTNNVLIHISPQDIDKVVSEMLRVCKKWIWGFEYFAPEYTEVSYRGNSDLLWKTDFSSLFLKQSNKLVTVRQEKFNCKDEPGNIDKSYLLRKT